MPQMTPNEQRGFGAAVGAMVCIVLLLVITVTRGCAYENVAESCDKSGSWTNNAIFATRSQGYTCAPIKQPPARDPHD